jgi:hypothetical protein
MRRAVAIACALGALACAPSALAGTPFTIGAGAYPHLLVDAASGTAHVAWQQGPYLANRVQYCRVPRGATGCAGPVQDLGAPPGDFNELGTPYLVRDGGTLYVIVRRFVPSDAYLKASSDGGATWSDWRKLYSGPNTNWSEPSEPILYGNGELLLPTWNYGVRAYAARLDGTEAAQSTVANLPQPDGNTYNFGVARPLDGGVAGTADNNQNLYLYRLTGTDPSVAGNWSGPALIGEGRESHLGSGPRGAYLVSTGGAASPFRTEVRRITSTGVTAPTVVANVANTAGVLARVGVGPSGVGIAYHGEQRLRFALSTNDGASFSAPYVIVPYEPITYSGLGVGLANDNQGFAVWQDSGAIRLATLEPYVDPVQQPPTGGGGLTRPPAQPPRRATRTTSVDVLNGGATLSLETPSTCVRPGATFKVTLKWKRKKKKGNLFVKVRRTDFYRDTKVVRKDRRAPFVHTYKVKVGEKSVKVRARAYIKVKRGRSPKKSISARVRVC